MPEDAIYTSELNKLASVPLHIELSALTDRFVRIILHGYRSGSCYRITDRLREDDVPNIQENLHNAATLLINQIFDENDVFDVSELVVRILTAQIGLAHRGHVALNSVFGNVGCDFINQESQLVPTNEIPFIRLISDEFMLPWDWLFNQHPSTVNGSLPDTVQNFWGFHSLVVRHTTELYDVYPKKYFEMKDPIRVGIAIDKTLPFAEEEAQGIMKQNASQTFEIFPLNPYNQNNEYSFISEFNNFLEQDYDIIHFASHVVVNNDDPLSSYITVDDGQEFYLLSLEDQVEIEIGAKIVFLNACASGVRNPKETYSFVHILLKRGVVAVIALEVGISSWVAEKFASKFYSYFFSKQHSIGESLYLARKDIIQSASETKDIMAMFYTLYGDPNIRIV